MCRHRAKRSAALFLLAWLAIVGGTRGATGDGTVALWLFDEPLDAANRSLLEDQTEQGYDLVLQRGARITAGKFGHALEIMGGGSRAAMRRYIDPTPLNLGDFDWTWEFLVQMKAAARAGDVVFEIRQGPFERGARTALEIGAEPGRLIFQCQPAGLDKQEIKSDEKLLRAADANWHHVALSYRAAEKRLIHWVDGRQMDSVVLPRAMAPLTSTGENNLNLGNDITGLRALPAIFDEVRVSRGVIYGESFSPPGSFAPKPEPNALGPGPHLFIDDSLIARSSNLARTTHQPQRLPEPVIREQEIYPGHAQQCGGNTVLYDPQTKRFRMWMSVKNLEYPEPDFYACTYWESTDGVTWQRPQPGVVSFNGRSDHNMVMTGRTHNLRFHSDSVLDEGPDAPDPQKRYKIGYFPLDWRQDHTRGMNVAFSPDGIRWTPYEGNPVLRHWDVTDGYPGAGLSVADINDMFYDPVRKLYVQTYKTYALPHEYPTAAPKRDERWREINDKTPGYRRVIGFCTSRDFIHWENFQRVMVPDDRDAPELQFYAMALLKRGDLYVAHVRCLDDQAEADGTGWMELATSRDLYHWTRHRDVFFDRNRQTDQWDSAISWHGRPVIVGDEMWFYYIGMGGGHKSGLRQIGLAKLRKDGYVSRNAGTDPGALVTAPIRLDASSLVVNAKVDGELKARIVNEDGSVIAGFDFGDFATVRGDSVSLPLKWTGDLASLRGRVVRLEFALTQGQLYAFEIIN